MARRPRRTQQQANARRRRTGEAARAGKEERKDLGEAYLRFEENQLDKIKRGEERRQQLLDWRRQRRKDLRTEVAASQKRVFDTQAEILSRYQDTTPTQQREAQGHADWRARQLERQTGTEGTARGKNNRSRSAMAAAMNAAVRQEQNRLARKFGVHPTQVSIEPAESGKIGVKFKIDTSERKYEDRGGVSQGRNDPLGRAKRTSPSTRLSANAAAGAATRRADITQDQYLSGLNAQESEQRKVLMEQAMQRFEEVDQPDGTKKYYYRSGSTQEEIDQEAYDIARNFASRRIDRNYDGSGDE